MGGHFEQELEASDHQRDAASEVEAGDDEEEEEEDGMLPPRDRVHVTTKIVAELQVNKNGVPINDDPAPAAAVGSVAQEAGQGSAATNHPVCDELLQSMKSQPAVMDSPMDSPSDDDEQEKPAASPAAPAQAPFETPKGKISLLFCFHVSALRRFAC